MIVDQAIEQLKQIAGKKMILCQVLDENGTAWNMHFEIHDVSDTNLVQLKVFHPDLKRLPDVEFGGGKIYPPQK